jgi:hypothetical protein
MICDDCSAATLVVINSDTAWQTPRVRDAVGTLDPRCEVCKNQLACEVCAINPAHEYEKLSHGFPTYRCLTCRLDDIHPLGSLVGLTSVRGGLRHCTAEWRVVVRRSLAYLKVPMDDFYDLVRGAAMETEGQEIVPY